MKKTFQRGFTLIELLVVIAIIGVLAGILFIAINPSNQINKSKDAKVKSYLASVPAKATISYDDNSYSYANVCTDLTVPSGYTCHDAADEWVVYADVPSDSASQIFCIDATGKGVITNTNATGIADTAGNRHCNAAI